MSERLIADIPYNIVELAVHDWVEEENFVIILAKRKNYYVLKTMYRHGRRKGENLLKEWNESEDPRKN